MTINSKKNVQPLKEYLHNHKAKRLYCKVTASIPWTLSVIVWSLTYRHWTTMELWKVLICITLFYVTFVSAGNQNNVKSVKPSENISLKEFMARSANIMLENPSTASSCSDYYLELIDCIFTEFEENNKACREKAISDRAAIDELTKDNQDALAERTDSAYAKVSQCRGEDSAQSVFQCYVDEVSWADTIEHLIRYNILFAH